MESDDEHEFQLSILNYFVWKAKEQALPDGMSPYQRLAKQMLNDFPELGTPPPQYQTKAPDLLDQLVSLSQQVRDLKKERDILQTTSLEYRGKYETVLTKYNNLQQQQLAQQHLQQLQQQQRKNPPPAAAAAAAAATTALPAAAAALARAAPAAAPVMLPLAVARTVAFVHAAPAVETIMFKKRALIPTFDADGNRVAKRARSSSSSNNKNSSSSNTKRKRKPKVKPIEQQHDYDGPPVYGPVKLDRHYTFDERVAELQRFHIQHGHCKIPKSDNVMPLFHWVNAVKAVYIHCQRFPQVMKLATTATGGPYFLNEERIARLQGIGNDGGAWLKEKEAAEEAEQPAAEADEQQSQNNNNKEGSSNKTTTKQRQRKIRVPFELRFEQLVIYKRRHGHLRVSAGDNKVFGDLAMWVKMMRRHKRENKAGFLEGDRYQRLNSIGFEWKTRDEPKSFEERLNECRAFRDKYQHLDVPKLPSVFQVAAEEDISSSTGGDGDGTSGKTNSQEDGSSGDRKQIADPGLPAAAATAQSTTVAAQDGGTVGGASNNAEGAADDSRNQEDDRKPAARPTVASPAATTATPNENDGNSDGGSTSKQQSNDVKETTTLDQDGGDKPSDLHQKVSADASAATTAKASDTGKNESEQDKGKSVQSQETASTKADIVVLSKQEFDFRKWAEKMRSQYWKFKAYGQDKVLNEERIAKLSEIGFVWGPPPPDNKVYEGELSHRRDEIRALANTSGERLHRASEKLFLDHIEKLKQCKEKYGTCMDRFVLQGMFPDDTTLLNWHQKMKGSYKELQAGKKTYLTQRRAEMLKAVGYDFEGRHLRMDRNKPRKPRKRSKPKPAKSVQLAAAALLDMGTGSRKDPPASTAAAAAGSILTQQEGTDLSPTRVSARIKEKKDIAKKKKKVAKRAKRDKTGDGSPRKKANKDNSSSTSSAKKTKTSST